MGDNQPQHADDVADDEGGVNVVYVTDDDLRESVRAIAERWGMTVEQALRAVGTYECHPKCYDGGRGWDIDTPMHMALGWDWYLRLDESIAWAARNDGGECG